MSSPSMARSRLTSRSSFRCVATASSAQRRGRQTHRRLPEQHVRWCSVRCRRRHLVQRLRSTVAARRQAKAVPARSGRAPKAADGEGGGAEPAESAAAKNSSRVQDERCRLARWTSERQDAVEAEAEAPKEAAAAANSALRMGPFRCCGSFALGKCYSDWTALRLLCASVRHICLPSRGATTHGAA